MRFSRANSKQGTSSSRWLLPIPVLVGVALLASTFLTFLGTHQAGHGYSGILEDGGGLASSGGITATKKQYTRSLSGVPSSQEILKELEPFHVIDYHSYGSPNPLATKDQLPLTVVVHHREFFAGCHSFERFFNPKWHTVVVVEADMAEQYRLRELAEAAAATSPAIHLAFLDQQKTMTGEWLGRQVALKIMNLSSGGSEQRTPLMLSTHCDIQPMPEFHALHKPYEDVVSRMVHLFLEEDRLNQQQQQTHVNDVAHDWTAVPLDPQVCEEEYSAKARPLLTMNVAMVETLPSSETLQGSTFHSKEALARPWAEVCSKPRHLPKDKPWMSDVSTWVEDHFNLYNVTLLEEIVDPLANVAATVSAGVKAIPQFLCEKGWKAVRLNDEPMFYDFQKVQLTSNTKVGSRSLYDSSKYKSVNMDWLLSTSIINLAKVNSPVGCLREYMRLRIFARVDVISSCCIAQHHFQSNHVPSHVWNSTIREIEPLAEAIMSLYGYELYEKTKKDITFSLVPAFHTISYETMARHLQMGDQEHEHGVLPKANNRPFIKFKRDSSLKKEAFFMESLEFRPDPINFSKSRVRQGEDAKVVCASLDRPKQDGGALLFPEVRQLADSCVSDYPWEVHNPPEMPDAPKKMPDATKKKKGKRGAKN